jgi:hypothetical protein
MLSKARAFLPRRGFGAIDNREFSTGLIWELISTIWDRLGPAGPRSGDLSAVG